VSPLEILRAVLVVAASFVIGGIPWGVLIAKVVGGPDPRTMGSGRTGGSNVMRALGPRVALVSGLLDASKGSVVVLLAWVVGAGTGVAVFAAMAAVVGHSRSVFLNFHGGRGVAPSWGALLVFQPLVALVVAPVFLAIIVLTRYSSVGSLSGSLIGGILLAVATAVTPLDPWLYVYAVGGPALVWLFHHDNIARLLAGKERKIGTPRT
jgi:acyl phosphate:glycerol-3-phosphate acyltransferase